MWYAILFLTSYLCIFIFPPKVFFTLELVTALAVFQHVANIPRSFIAAPSFSFRRKHFLLFILFIYLLCISFTTPLGFKLFFTIPLGYLMNPSRFIALCFLFFLFLCMNSEPGNKTLKTLHTMLKSSGGKIAVIWLAGFLSSFSTLHSTNFFHCPPSESLVGYQEILGQSVCRAHKNFLLADACRHDTGTLYDIAYDEKKKNVYMVHNARGKESPLCMLSLQRRHHHKIMEYFGAGAHRVLLNRHNHTLLLPLMSDSKILLVDSNTLNVKKSFNVSARFLVDAVLDENKKTLYVLSENNTVFKIHLPTGKIKKTSFRQNAGANAYGMALNTETQILYITSWLGGILTRINANTLELQQIKRFPPSLMGIGVNEDKNEVYVARPFPSAVLVLDGTTLQKKAKLHSNFGTRGIVYLPDKKLLAAGNYFAGTVQFFDVQSRSQVFRFYVGQILRGLTYDAASQNVFSYSGCGVYKFPLGEIYAQQKH